MNSLSKILLGLIATLPSAQAVTVILGDTSGDARGEHTVDIQSFRGSSSQVASGLHSVAVGKQITTSGGTSMGFGINNIVSGFAGVGIGLGNFVAGSESFAAGHYNSVQSGSYAVILGTENISNGDHTLGLGYYNIVAAETVAVGFCNSTTGVGYAFGYDNVIAGGDAGAASNYLSYDPSAAFGMSNQIIVGANNSLAFGRANLVSAPNASVFGASIVNAVANSTMIGPSDSAKVTILSSGNVGIGTSTPTSKLHVVGDLNVTGSVINPSLNGSGSGSTTRLRVGGTATPGAAWQGTAVVGADGQNKIIAGYLGSATGGAVIGAHNSALNAWADLNVAGTNLIFRTNETERMRINSSGNVGLGTNNPAAKLHISSTGTDRGLRIQSTGSTSNDYAEAQFAANAREYRLGTGSSGSTVGLANKFYIWDSTAGAARAVIDSNGNLGVGTTSPQTKLHVAGDVRVEGTLSTAAITRITPIFIHGTSFYHGGGQQFRSVKIGSTIISVNGAGLHLLILDKSTHAPIASAPTGTLYNTYGSHANSDNLAIALNGMTRNQIGILTSSDSWEASISPNLKVAFRRLGLTKAEMAKGPQASGGERQPYAAIFEGASNNAAGATSVEVIMPGYNGDQPVAHISGWLLDGSFAVTPSSVQNALHSPNGEKLAVQVAHNGDIAVKTTLRVPKRGDIDMGGFMTGTNPEL